MEISKRQRLRVVGVLAPLLAPLLAACGGADEGDGGLAAAPDPLFSLFDPVAASPAIPFPNDLLFVGSTDGTLNIPNPSAAPFVDAANALDGFSTVASLFTDFIGRVDIESANRPGAVVVIDTRRFSALLPGVDYHVQSSAALDPATGIPLDVLRTRLLIEPLRPLAPATTYLVAVTRQTQSADGVPAQAADLFRVLASASSVDEQLATRAEPALTLLGAEQRARLEALRQQYQSRVFPALAAAGLAADDVVVAWSFTTQSLQTSLAELADLAEAQPLQLLATGLTVQDLIPQLPPVADIYVGSLSLPYYLADATATAEDADFLLADVPDNPLNSFWRADPASPAAGAMPAGVPCEQLAQGGVSTLSTTACFPRPLERAAQQVPVIASVPNSGSGTNMPPAGWPVVIFQHGITGNRTQMLPLVPALTAAGFAVIAIDMPLHGLPPGHPLRVPGTTERSFDLDLVDNATGLPSADGVADGSGTHFINLSSLLTSRDNLRQAVADLLSLRASVGGALLLASGAGGPQPSGITLNGEALRFVGHSLGGIVGTPMLGVDTRIGAASLAMAGGGIAKLLDASLSFGPRIAGGLLAASGGSIAEGNDNYETFLRFAQQVVDDGDPINYAAAAAVNHPIHLLQVQGDRVVPNCARVDPLVCAATDALTVGGDLSGTDPLARVMDLSFIPGPTQADALEVPAQPLILSGEAAAHVVVRFRQGDHASILSPEASLDVTCEMQGQVAGFLASNGSQLRIGNPCPATTQSARQGEATQ